MRPFAKGRYYRPTMDATTVPAFRAALGTGPSRPLLLAGRIALAILASVALALSSGHLTQAANDSDAVAIDMVAVAEGFEQPVFVAAAPGEAGTLYVVEQRGLVRVTDRDGAVAEQPFVDLTADVSFGGERGLLGLAFHPDYEANGRFFVNYTRAADGATVVSEITATEGSADPASERQLLLIDQPFGNHNGGMIAFDASGMLLIGTGDGGAGGDPLGAGQDPSSLLGKLLRIDVDAGDPYAIPADNGFADEDAFRPEIHALGLRNPWRFSVDAAGGHVYIGDVGQGSWEEVSMLPAGRGGFNFGWNAVEGPECFSDGCDVSAFASPVLAYRHDEGCSIVGGHTYRGTQQPALEGIYLFGDYCSGTIWAAPADAMLSGIASATPVHEFDGDLVSFGADEAGELYAVDQRGRILRIVAATGS
jgi:glucose/arabinose dehydrogenase